MLLLSTPLAIKAIAIKITQVNFTLSRYLVICFMTLVPVIKLNYGIANVLYCLSATPYRLSLLAKVTQSFLEELRRDHF